MAGAGKKNRNDEKLGEVLDFMRCVWELHHGLQSRSKRMAAEMGITGPQRLVIRLVGQRPGISAGELAALLHIHPSTLTGVLSRLETRGFVKRRSDPEDRRRAVIDLTASGKTVDAQRGGTVEASMKKALRRVSEPDMVATRKVLKLLAHELGDGEMD